MYREMLPTQQGSGIIDLTKVFGQENYSANGGGLVTIPSPQYTPTNFVKPARWIIRWQNGGNGSPTNDQWKNAHMIANYNPLTNEITYFGNYMEDWESDDHGVTWTKHATRAWKIISTTDDAYTVQLINKNNGQQVSVSVNPFRWRAVYITEPVQ